MKRLWKKQLAAVLLGALLSQMPTLGEPQQARASPGTSTAPPRYVIDAWYPGWTTPGISGYRSLSLHASLVDKVNPYWYALRPDGSVTPYVWAEDPRLLALARRSGKPVMPLVTNEFDPARVHRMLSTRASREAHIAELVELAVDGGYAGLDLDYEMMYALDRDNFSLFVEGLALRLGAEGKKLSIAVHAKTSEPGAWRGAQAQDWKRLGRAVDEFKIMTYDYHWDDSAPGPVAPPGWIDRVLSFAETQVAPRKIRMGLAFHGREWVGFEGRSLVYAQVQSLTRKHNKPPVHRRSAGEPYFRYAGGHVVYYQDAHSLATKLNVLVDRHPEIGGIAIWHVGGEAHGFWGVIKDKLER